MANTIQIKRSSTISDVPTAGQLVEGEMAIATNPADRKLYSKDSGGTVFEIGAAYSHPSHPGDDFSVDSGALSGATVISDIDINVTTDSLGHVTDANGTIATRNLTAGQIGAGALSANEAITGNWTIDDPQSTAQPLGYNTMPIYGINANDIFDTAHQGMLWHKDSGGAGIEFSCNNVSAIDQGATWIVHNDASDDLTIAQGSGVTIFYLVAGAAPVTGNVVISQGAIVTVYKVTNTEYWVWGAKDSASGYTHPTHPGDDFDQDTGLLANAFVVSDININLVTDTLGHVTDANCVIATRQLTAGNIGAATTGHTHETYDHSAHLGSANVFDQINVTNGIVTSILTRALTAANIGAAATAHSHTTSEISGLDAGADFSSGTMPVSRGGTGVTASTGTGNTVRSASPAFTGTVTGAALTFTGQVQGGTLNASSDVRLKENLSRYVPRVLTFKTYSYDLKAGDQKNKVGYLAHEVVKDLPGAVVRGKDGMLALDYNMVLVAKIAELEARLNAAGIK